MPSTISRQKLRNILRPMHIGLCLTLLSLCTLFLTDLLGFRDDGHALVSESRQALAETVAIQLSTLANVNDRGGIEYTISNLIKNGSNIQAVSLIGKGESVIASFGDTHIFQKFSPFSSISHVSVPILDGKKKWGELRIVFTPLRNILRETMGVIFFVLTSIIVFTALLNKAFLQLDPNRAVPDRVETAFNMFASGVIILDNNLRIIMANEAACQLAGMEREYLIGAALKDWKWKDKSDFQEPWKTTLNSGLIVSDKPLRLVQGDGGSRLLMVSCSLVEDENENSRGVMVTLDDVSSIEKKNKELAMTLKQLRNSQELISTKNKELERLATTDALTGISNRRVLMETLAHMYENAKKQNSPLACIMTDIDHFKSVNDTYGHAIGDDVICAVSNTLANSCNEDQMVGRYGGEEFVLIFPGLDAIEAAEIAERIRRAIILLPDKKDLAVENLSLSFGISDMSHHAKNSNELVDFADQALYLSKQSGRNCVSIYDKNTSRDTSRMLATKAPTVPYDVSDVRLDKMEELLKQRELEIEVLKNFDSVTGVPMRTLLTQRVDIELQRARRIGTSVGVLSIELRDYDRLISSFGSSAYDQLVVSVVDRLQDGLRSSDMVTNISADSSLSRITSNEFGIVLSEITEPSGALVVVARLKRLLLKPFLINEQRVYIGVNIGISLSQTENTTTTWLFDQASKARIVASKNPDKVSHAFATETLTDQSYEYISLESDLHDALDARQLEVYYQPKFDLNTRCITGMEALIRWNHESRGFVSPELFVGAAEKNGLIDQLTHFVFYESLQQMRIWQEMGFLDIVVSVNVSPMQLRAESLVQSTLNALERTGVKGQYLELELTETSVLDNPEQAIEALNKLRAENISISIDDFGTGYSSIGLLSNLPIDVLKIDRSFITAMRSSDQSRLIVQSIIAMAHAMKLRVVGEGVETNADLELLIELGCDLIQGYLISRPVPADEMTAFLREQQRSANIRRA